MRKRRGLTVFSLSFLDAMTCGFGAVVLFFMVINASVGLRAERMTSDLSGEVDMLQDEVLDGHKNLVELRNALREIDEAQVRASGLSRRLLESLEEIRVELASYDRTTLASREHIAKLQTDLKSLEEDAVRLSAAAPDDATPGDRTRTFVGDGDRQYLTGLKVGGKRILILVDTSASMLADTVVNIIRLRNMDDADKLRAAKWRQAVMTVDWLTTQIPRDAEFQVYTFGERAGSVVEGTTGRWLDGSDRARLESAVQALRRVVPGGGTNLAGGLATIKDLNPRPDNLILLVDGLPTRDASKPKRRTVSGKRRIKLFNAAIRELPRGFPVNVILFPMEGDPAAPAAFWRLAQGTGGSFMAPSEDWP
jgi:hypothetical protein